MTTATTLYIQTAPHVVDHSMTMSAADIAATVAAAANGGGVAVNGGVAAAPAGGSAAAAMYATKRRRRNVKTACKSPGAGKDGEAVSGSVVGNMSIASSNASSLSSSVMGVVAPNDANSAAAAAVAAAASELASPLATPPTMTMTMPMTTTSTATTTTTPSALGSGTQPKSNPSKRHRERLNGELDHLASLLPFDSVGNSSIISKLDRLSILRLAVAYLRTKAHFQPLNSNRMSSLTKDGHLTASTLSAESPTQIYTACGPQPFSEGDSVLEALNGFMIMTTSHDGEVFYASRTVEQYLGFHQSDIVHQSVFELIHSEDREDFKTQLLWNSLLPADQRELTLNQVLSSPEHRRFLERSFTVRFRCLLDNTSGFVTLDICGRLRPIHNQNMKGVPEDSPVLALFAVACPFGPPSLHETPQRDIMFKSKHKLCLAPQTIDHRGRLLLGFAERDFSAKGGYDLIHPDDLTYFSTAHQELLKTGSSGLVAYRWQTKDSRWQWLQTSMRVVYKNNKPDYVLGTHRPLTEDEGRDLFGKRGTEFKLPYPFIDLDGSLALPASAHTTDSGNGGSGGGDDFVSKVKAQRSRKNNNNNNINSGGGKSASSSSSSSTPSSKKQKTSAAAAAAAAANAAAANATAATATIMSQTPTQQQHHIEGSGAQQLQQPAIIFKPELISPSAGGHSPNNGYASPQSAYAFISHQADVKPELYAYAPTYAANNGSGAMASSDLYATANHDAFSAVLTNQMYSSFPAAVAAAAEGSSYDAAATAAAAAGLSSRSAYSNAIYALDPVNHPYAHSLKYHAANTTASYSELLGPKYAAFDVRYSPNSYNSEEDLSKYPSAVAYPAASGYGYDLIGGSAAAALTAAAHAAAASGSSASGASPAADSSVLLAPLPPSSSSVQLPGNSSSPSITPFSAFLRPPSSIAASPKIEPTEDSLQHHHHHQQQQQPHPHQHQHAPNVIVQQLQQLQTGEVIRLENGEITGVLTASGEVLQHHEIVDQQHHHPQQHQIYGATVIHSGEGESSIGAALSSLHHQQLQHQEDIAASSGGIPNAMTPPSRNMPMSSYLPAVSAASASSASAAVASHGDGAATPTGESNASPHRLNSAAHQHHLQQQQQQHGGVMTYSPMSHRQQQRHAGDSYAEGSGVLGLSSHDATAVALSPASLAFSAASYDATTTYVIAHDGVIKAAPTSVIQQTGHLQQQQQQQQQEQQQQMFAGGASIQVPVVKTSAWARSSPATYESADQWSHQHTQDMIVAQSSPFSRHQQQQQQQQQMQQQFVNSTSPRAAATANDVASERNFYYASFQASTLPTSTSDHLMSSADASAGDLLSSGHAISDPNVNSMQIPLSRVASSSSSTSCSSVSSALPPCTMASVGISGAIVTTAESNPLLSFSEVTQTLLTE